MIGQKFCIVNDIISVEFDAKGVPNFYNAAVKPWRSQFKDNCDVVRVVARWLTTQGTDCYQEGADSLVPRYDQRFNFEGTKLKIRGQQNN
jgi:hypothetical protein